MATDLYRRSTEWAEKRQDPRGLALHHKVWDATPWMVNAYTGRIGDERDAEIREWCSEQFGDEAWPIHGRPGLWHRGGGTVNGWTWIGFATQEMMDRFEAAWPAPEGVESN